MPPRRRGLVESVLRVTAATRRSPDTYVDLVLAVATTPVAALIGEGDLFRIQAGAATVAVDVDLKPAFWLPDRYEPAWFPQKTLATEAELDRLPGE